MSPAAFDNTRRHLIPFFCTAGFGSANRYRSFHLCIRIYHRQPILYPENSRKMVIGLFQNAQHLSLFQIAASLPYRNFHTVARQSTH